MKTQFITVNKKRIIITTDKNERYIAIKPICEALGVNYRVQLDKIKCDEVLGQLCTLRGIVAADGKKREMHVIPFNFVFGWLFTINPKNVKSEIKENVILFRMQCYNALMETFTKRNKILQVKHNYISERLKLEEELKTDDRYKKVLELKALEKDQSKILSNLDKGVYIEQLDLFRN